MANIGNLPGIASTTAQQPRYATPIINRNKGSAPSDSTPRTRESPKSRRRQKVLEARSAGSVAVSPVAYSLELRLPRDTATRRTAPTSLESQELRSELDEDHIVYIEMAALVKMRVNRRAACHADNAGKEYTAKFLSDQFQNLSKSKRLQEFMPDSNLDVALLPVALRAVREKKVLEVYGPDEDPNLFVADDSDEEDAAV
ncbi:hypothetical protein BKA56DRAFT_681485 [Ilyonectria sp. MPI-CAGE-AT-0026]|nr:hypothetical protein BKA56DRAFT_681485 [Ilyonectria sp. MPI-CAGE-AT-0026]